jgi:hypothetical protein
MRVNLQFASAAVPFRSVKPSSTQLAWQVGKLIGSGRHGAGVAGLDRSVSCGVSAELLSGLNTDMPTYMAVRNSSAAAMSPTARGRPVTKVRSDGRARRFPEDDRGRAARWPGSAEGSLYVVAGPSVRGGISD